MNLFMWQHMRWDRSIVINIFSLRPLYIFPLKLLSPFFNTFTHAPKVFAYFKTTKKRLIECSDGCINSKREGCVHEWKIEIFVYEFRSHFLSFFALSLSLHTISPTVCFMIKKFFFWQISYSWNIKVKNLHGEFLWEFTHFVSDFVIKNIIEWSELHKFLHKSNLWGMAMWYLH